MCIGKGISLRELFGWWSVGVILLCPAAAAPEGRLPRIPEFSRDELVQGFSNHRILALPRPDPANEHDTAAETALTEFETAAGFETERVYANFDGLRVLRLPPSLTPTAAIQLLTDTGRYEFVEVDAIVQSSVTPTDPAFVDRSQWHHQNTGQGGGLPQVDIASVKAWDTIHDASDVIVAVIDSGARLTHQDIAPNLWTNPREIAGNGIDDDGNGYIDDIHGIDARLGTGYPMDPPDFGHGTRVAGIIGAAANNGVGGVGVAWRVRLMPLLFLGGTSQGGTISDEIECINYAILMGAKVINASFGSSQFSLAEQQAIERARDADIVFVTAAGNQSKTLDLTDHFPGNHPVDNLVVVANSDRRDELYFESNQSSGRVDLAAPGTDILTLGSTSDIATFTDTGSSMSAPMVTGAVALLRARYPLDGYRDTINRLLRGARSVNSLQGIVQTGGRLDVAQALNTTNTRPFNDDFADRAVLAGEVVTVRSSTTNATVEAIEPPHAGHSVRSLWFSWTAPTAGRVKIDSSGSVGDTKLAVYTGSQLATLTRVTENDNASGETLSALVEFDAAAGATYQIAVDGTIAGLVMMRLSLSAHNDAFAAAQLLDADQPVVVTSNANATREAGEPTHVSGSNNRTLWYQWQAPHDGLFQVSAHSLSADPTLALYTGSTLATLQRVGSNHNSGVGGANLNSLISFNAIAGIPYSIALDTAGSIDGPVTLSITDALWQFATGQTASSALRRPLVLASPAVGPDGALYVGSTDRYFYALNPNGSLRWRIAPSVDPELEPPVITESALASDGAIHFGTNGGFAYALNPDGNARWIANPSPSPFLVAPAVAADGTSYYAQADGILRAFSPSGVLRWSYVVPGLTNFGSPVVSSDGTVILPANDGALHAVDPVTGTRRWRYQPQTSSSTDDHNGIHSSPALDASNNIYAATHSGTVFSVTPNGERRWSFHSASPEETISSSPALGEGRVYFATDGGTLYALQQNDGSLLWQTSIASAARSSSPAIAADGSILVANKTDRLFRVSRDGVVQRSWLVGPGATSSPTVAFGRAYVGNHDGKVYAFDLDGTEPAVGPEYPWPQYRHGPRQLGRRTAEVIGLSPVIDDNNPGRLANLSVRNLTRRGLDALTAGFVLESSTGKPLVIRGIGPTLTDFGVSGSLAETILRVYDTVNPTTPLASNDGWLLATGDGRELGAFPLPTGSADSVIRQQFNGAAYTAEVVPPAESAPGITLLEIYDANTDDLQSRLTNLSARTALAPNASVTMGFVISGNSPRTVLIRAIGPGLGAFGVDGVLTDPRLVLFREGTAESGNDDWSGTAFIQNAAQTVGAFALDAASKDAALLTTLPPGSYTAQVTAPADQNGIVLVEVYLLEN